MEVINKAKVFVIKYKYYILGAVALLVLYKVFSNSSGGASQSSGGEYMVANPNSNAAPADNTMAIMQAQMQQQLAQQKAVFAHENELADKQLAAKAQEWEIQKQVNAGNLEIEKSKIANDRYISEQNALIAKYNQEAADRNTQRQLDYQTQLQQSQMKYQDQQNTLATQLKMQELDTQRWLGGAQLDYQKYATDKQTQLAKKQINSQLIGSIVGSGMNLIGNVMTGGAWNTAKSVGNAPKSYAF